MSREEPNGRNQVQRLATADQMRQRGLPRFNVDAVVEPPLALLPPFGTDEIATLRGPPGGMMLGVSLWDCSGLEQSSLDAIAQAKLGHRRVTLQIGLPSKVVLAERERDAISAHVSIANEIIAWLLVRIHERLVVAFAASVDAEVPLSASSILSEPALRTLADTLQFTEE